MNMCLVTRQVGRYLNIMTTTHTHLEQLIALGEVVAMASNKAKKASKSKDQQVLVPLTLRF